MSRAGYRSTTWCGTLPRRDPSPVIQSTAAEAGFGLKIRVTEVATALKQGEDGNFQLYQYTWSGRPDPDGNAVIYQPCGAPQNMAHYCDKELDAWHCEARATGDPAARTAIYEKTTARFLEQGWWAPPFCWATSGRPRASSSRCRPQNEDRCVQEGAGAKCVDAGGHASSRPRPVQSGRTIGRMQSDEFILTQEFLAMMLGVQRTGVSAAAGVLKRAGLVRYRREIVTILDRRGLRRLSCGCLLLYHRGYRRELLSKARVRRSVQK